MGLSSNKKSKVMKEVEEDTIAIPVQVYGNFSSLIHFTPYLTRKSNFPPFLLTAYDLQQFNDLVLIKSKFSHRERSQ